MRLSLQAIAVELILLPGSVVAQDIPAQRDDVIRFVADYVEATNAGNMTAYVDMYVHRSDLMTVDDGTLKRGWEVVRDEANAAAGFQGAYRVATGVVEVLRLAEDVALAVVPFVINIS